MTTRLLYLIIPATLLAAGCGKKGNAEPGSGSATATEKEEHEEGGHDEGMVRLTKEQVATAKIATAVVAARAVSSEIAATAEIVPPDDGIARVGAKVPGRLTKLAVGVGDAVKLGQLIAYVDAPELGKAKGDYLSAAAIARVTRETADREKALYDKKISSERDYRLAEAEATKARAEKEATEARLHSLGLSEGAVSQLSADQHSSSTIAVTAPIAGMIVERAVSLGQMVEPQGTIAVIMDLRTVWLQVDVYEKDLAKLALKQKVTATVTAWPERTFEGEIQSIGAVLDRRSRTVKVRVVVTNTDGALKPGMFAKVLLSGSSGEPRQGLFVPASAIQRDGEEFIVFVPVGDHEFQLRKVETGVTTAEWIEIKHGLVAGEKVVTSGAFQLKSEARRESMGEHEH